MGWNGPAPKWKGQKEILVLLLHELTDLCLKSGFHLL